MPTPRRHPARRLLVVLPAALALLALAAAPAAAAPIEVLGGGLFSSER